MDLMERDRIQTKETVPFSLEVRQAMALRNKGLPAEAGHRIPESEAAINKAERLTYTLTSLLNDQAMHPYAGHIMTMADSMLVWGEITDAQFLSLNTAYKRVALTSNSTEETPH